MDDLISRQAAIEALRRAEALTKAFGYHNVIETIRDLPTADIDLSDYSDHLWRNAYEQGKADAEPRKKGKWIEAEPRSGRLGWVCSCCDHEAYWDSDYGQQLFGWCPWCGAEMKGERNEHLSWEFNAGTD